MKPQPVPPHRDPEVIDASTSALATFRELCPSLGIAVTLTDDGFEVARTPATANADQRLASMASSLQALSEAITRELALGNAQYALLEAEAGHVLMRRVPGRQLVLAAVFGSDETVGRAVSVSRHVVEELGARLGDRAA